MWARLDVDRKRAVIDLLVEVVILPVAKGRPKGHRPGESYFRPESVRITPKAG